MAKPKIRRFTCSKCKKTEWDSPNESERQHLADVFVACKSPTCGMVDHLETGNSYGGIVIWGDGKEAAMFQWPDSKNIVKEPEALQWQRRSGHSLWL